MVRQRTAGAKRDMRYLPTRKSKVETNQPKRILYFEVKVTSFQYSASRLRSLKPRTKYWEGEETTSFLDVVLL